MRMLSRSKTSSTKETSVAKFVVLHQLINCIRCEHLGKCELTRSLAEMAMKGKIDPDAIEAISYCGNVGPKEVIRISRKINGGSLTKVLPSLYGKSPRLSSFNEGYVLNLGLASLVIDKESNDGPANAMLALSYSLRASGHGCTVVINKVRNEYLGYLATVARNVVPNGDYSLQSLVSAREWFLSLFIDDRRYGVIALLASLGLDDLAPLLLDEEVEDVFVTQDSIYINHARYGTCKVLNSDPQVIAKQLLRLANLSGVRVSTDSPSGKYSLSIAGRRLRVTVDRWPLVEGIAVHVRAHKRPFTITDLIDVGTLNIVDAAKLILAVRGGYNILIMGPPSSGKTTLLNALDMAIPLGLRRIYIDETDESLELPVPSVKVRAIIGKTEEVLKSLHRGYGILIIGELREREHFEALVHGVNAGLQVLATTHADGTQQLMSRLRVFSLDGVVDLSKYVLVVMERVKGVRRVRSITYPQGFVVSQEKLHAVSSIIAGLRGVSNYVDYAIQLNNAIEELGGELS